MRHSPNDPTVVGGDGHWSATIQTPEGERKVAIEADDWNSALLEARRQQRVALRARRSLATDGQRAAGFMSANDYADRIGVKRGTLKRWIHEGMPVYRDWSLGPRPTVSVPVALADGWVSEHHGDSLAIERESFVYFARRTDTEAIKIGFSSDPRRRPQEIRKRERSRRGACGRVELLGQYPGDKRDELALHARFAGARILEEWFRPVPELLEHIEERCGTTAISQERGA